MAAKQKELYDLVVVGGGPAGAASAWRAASDGRSVLVVEKDVFPRKAGPGLAWIGPAGVELCREMGLSEKKAGAAPFAGLRLHSWNLTKSSVVDDPELRGWVVDRRVLDQALLKAAVSAGADALHKADVVEIELRERRVDLRFADGRQAAGSIVLIADGTSSPTARRAKLTPASHSQHVFTCVFTEHKVADDGVRLEVVVGASRTGQNATIVTLGKRVGVSLTMRGEPESIRDEFRRFCLAAVEHELLPSMPPEPLTRLSPGGVALDMDTHVGKRCLLIGDAGGFVAAFSNEGVYPAMRSGCIAAETALRALDAPVLQDELATFGVAWRGELADYLRMPNTDLSLLIPLVFNNEQMSRRVAKAFLMGHPF